MRYVGWCRCGTGDWTAVVACPLEGLCWAIVLHLFRDCDDAGDVERVVLPQGVLPDGRQSNPQG